MKRWIPLCMFVLTQGCVANGSLTRSLGFGPSSPPPPPPTSPASPASSTSPAPHPVASESTTGPSVPATSRIQAPINDEGLRGDAHRKHAGKIVFSNAPIARDNANASAFIDTASILKPIYTRVYFASSAYNLIGETGRLCPTDLPLELEWITSVRVNDGKEVTLSNKRVVDKLFKDSTTYPLGDDEKDALNDGVLLYPRDNDGTNNENAYPLMVDFRFATRIVSQLVPGKNTLTFRVQVRCGERADGVIGTDAARGKLTINLQPGDVAKFQAAHGPNLTEYPLADWSKLKDAAHRLYKSRMGRDAVLLVPVHDWEYSQNALGVVTMREVTVVAIERSSETGQCTITQIGVEQRAAGPNRFESSVGWGGESIDRPKPFPCKPRLIRTRR